MANNRNDRRAARFIGVFLLALFLSIYAACAEVDSLRCRRDEGSCVLEQATLLKKRRTTFAVADLLGAQEQGFKTSSSQGTKATMLLTRQGPVQFELGESSFAANIDWEVRDFVKHPKQRELLVTHDTRLTIVGFGAFLLVGSALLLWLGFRKPTGAMPSR